MPYSLYTTYLYTMGQNGRQILHTGGYFVASNVSVSKKEYQDLSLIQFNDACILSDSLMIGSQPKLLLDCTF